MEGPPAMEMDDIYAINLAKTRYRDGFDLGDAELVLSVYDDSFADMSFGIPSFYYSDARDVFRASLERTFQEYTATMTIILIDIVLNGDKAFDWGWHVLDLTSKQTGEQHRLRTRYFETWRRDAAKGWLITSFIDNVDLEPRLPQDVIADIKYGDLFTPYSRLERLTQCVAEVPT
jgi:ketosteroid isomerase-like protein